MDLQEFLEQIGFYTDQAANIGYEFTAGDIWLEPDIDRIEDLDQVVTRLREFWLRDQITEEAAWNGAVTFGVLFGEMLIRSCKGCEWVLNAEGLPVLQSGDTQFSPIMAIQKYIADEDDDPGKPSVACQGFADQVH